MPVYHIALFRLKQGVEVKLVEEWQERARNMVGQVPGLLDLQAGPPIEMTAPNAKGFDMGVAVLVDYVETLATFFTHPSHDEVHKLYLKVCDAEHTIGYDIEF